MTLTQTASITKKALAGSVIFAFSALFLFIGYKVYYNDFYLPHKPPPVILPDVKYGILPKPNLPESTSSSAIYKYSLNTQTGDLPTDFPKLVKVFFVPQLGTTLLAPEKIQNLADALGFNKGPDISNQTEYHFTDDNGGKLTIDLNSGNFSFERPSTNSATLKEFTMPDQTTIVSSFRSYLGLKGLLTPELSGGKSAVTYNDQTVANATQADVTIWPSNLDGLPIVTPDFGSGLITATTTKAPDENYRYPIVAYTFWPTDENTASTYPIKPVSKAFNELKGGQGYIALTPKENPVSVTQVYLAYLETSSYSPYIQPVYVFEGPDFSAYVAAITSDYLSK